MEDSFKKGATEEKRSTNITSLSLKPLMRSWRGSFRAAWESDFKPPPRTGMYTESQNLVGFVPFLKMQ